jgi:uncharacterized protein
MVLNFEWDENKNLENQAKHHLSFEEAQEAFFDPKRHIAIDIAHSTKAEKRYYCFGKAGQAIITVRFTKRGSVVRIIGAGYWRKGKKFMKRKKIKYTNEPIEAKIIGDFLPPPSKLVRKESSIKVTLTLSKRSVEFFKHHAEKQDIGYQTMMRCVIDKYTDHFSG